MITKDDIFDVAGQVLEIPLDAIREAPDNVRSELGDIAGIAASIREVGVLQPVLVIPDEGGETFMLFAGARRLAGAREAGLLTIPSIIRTKPENAKRVIAMLIENVQRSDLSPIDEARTFDRLIGEFEIDQVALAQRVGCSQSHVSKRLSLLDLPTKARKMIVDGDLTIAAGVELAKLAEHPDRMKAALAHVVDGWEADRAVRAELDDVAAQAAIADAVAKCEKAGTKVLWTQTGWITGKDREKRDRALAGAVLVDKAGGYHGGKVLEFAKPAAHDKEPCRAVVLEVLGRSVKVDHARYCTDPKRHTVKGESALKAVKKATTGPSAEEQERKKRLDARVAHRRQFVHELVRERKLEKGTVTTLAFEAAALNGYHDTQTRTAEILGLDLTGRNPEQAIRDHCAGGHDALMRAALAGLLANAVNPHLSGDDQDLLESLGFEPTEEERAEREEASAWRRANDAAERVWARYDVLDRPVPADVNELIDEIENGELTVARADELVQALNVHLEQLPPTDPEFAEVNDLQPDDVVEQTDDGEHTIDRAAIVDHRRWHVYGDTSPSGSTTYVRPGLEDAEEAAETLMLNDAELHWLAVFDRKPSELEVVEALHAARATGEVAAHPPTPTAKGCPFPGCTLAEHDTGAHRFKISALTDYAKAPKDCSPVEHSARLELDALLANHPDVLDDELRGLQQELFAGIDAARAAEIRVRVGQIAQPLTEPLTDYMQAAVGPMEKSCRELIALLPADHDRVVVLQQELYATVSTSRANQIKGELKKIRTELELEETT